MSHWTWVNGVSLFLCTLTTAYAELKYSAITVYHITQLMNKSTHLRMIAILLISDDQKISMLIESFCKFMDTKSSVVMWKRRTL